MNGIEILETKKIPTEVVYNRMAAWISAGIIFLCFLVIGTFTSIEEHTLAGVLNCAVIGICMGELLGCVVGAIFATHTAYETEYRVMVSDEVKLKEFIEKYEIVDQEGEIFTVRERQEEGSL